MHADPMRTKPVAIIVPIEHQLRNVAAGLVGQHDSLESLAKNAPVCQLVLEQLQMTARRMGLSSIETVEAVVLSPDEWGPMNVSLAEYRFHIDGVWSALGLIPLF